MVKALVLVSLLAGCELYAGGGGHREDAGARDAAAADSAVDALLVDAAPPDAPVEIACDQVTQGMTERPDLGVCDVVVPTDGQPENGFCTPMTGGATWTCDDVWVDVTGRYGVPLTYPDGGCSIAWCADTPH